MENNNNNNNNNQHALKFDIFDLLCLIHQNNNKNNNNNQIYQQLPIKEFSDNPHQNLDILDILLFNSRRGGEGGEGGKGGGGGGGGKLPFYYPRQRRNMVDMVRIIPNQLKKTFKNDNLTIAHHRYLSALSILYEYYIYCLTDSQIINARFAIRNAIAQEQQIRYDAGGGGGGGGGGEKDKKEEKEGASTSFYDYGEQHKTKIRKYTQDWYDLSQLTVDLSHMSNTEKSMLITLGEGNGKGKSGSGGGGGGGFRSWIIPQFLFLHLSLIRELLGIEI